jgi:hypothetical protein
VTSAAGLSRHAAESARATSDRPDLWLAGALSAAPFLAWLPLVLTVAAPPRMSDLAFIGAGLLSSGWFPWNLLLLAGLAALGVLLGCLLAALGEAGMLRAAGRGATDRSLTRETEVAFSVLLAASLPAVAALAALATATAAVAPAEFGAPDIGGPLILRIAAHLVPLLVLLGALILIGQATGAAALRRAVGPGALPIGAALRAGLRDLVSHPLRRLGLALATTLADLLALGLALALLRVLWAPISVELAAGQLVSPQALLLLVGFVAIWLALVLAFGALHAWVSNLWSLELAGASVDAQPDAPEVRL